MFPIGLVVALLEYFMNFFVCHYSKDSEIIKFYKNLEGLIGKDMSYKIKNEITNQLIPNNQVMQNNRKNISFNISLCHLCQYNKNDCVILLCGHLICKKCARNITRCK